MAHILIQLMWASLELGALGVLVLWAIALLALSILLLDNGLDEVIGPLRHR